ncbi:MAG TPA: glycosyltransferase, partial [Candidatus Limnocylindrales bacterium]|nr:glycosyltransferase [Candidatus Limnocylindrales bacterium]
MSVESTEPIEASRPVEPVEPVPPGIVALAQERAHARAARDWQAADVLRGRIEAAGWRVIDAGLDFSLAPARRTDVKEAGVTFHGTPDSVPSKLHEPATKAASVLVIAAAGDAALAATLQALGDHRAASTEVLVVVPRVAATAELESVTAAIDAELVRTVEPFSPGHALTAGLRRTAGAVVVVLDPDRVASGDVVSPLVARLADPSVAIVGVAGLRSPDLRRFHPAGPGDVTALASGCYAFR